MYKEKYYKYKNKYLGLTKEEGFDDPDKVDAAESPDLKEAPIEVYDAASDDEDEIIEDLEDQALKKEDFQGFDIDKGTKTSDFVTENLQQQIVDIGELGKARGKKYNIEEFDSDVFTTINRLNKNKILALKNQNDFDKFTNKYGSKKKKKVFIKWDKVQKDFKGVYITKSVLGDRSDTIPYQDRTTTDNWLYYDYNMLDDVVIFHKYRNLINFKEINKPFHGLVVDEYAISDTDFAKYYDKITFDKILVIDNVKSFDKFTNKYGKILKSSKKKYIDINWKNVNHNYDGFYIDKDNTFFRERRNQAFYKGEKFESWVKKNKLNKGLVYIFN
jgi:hypothetical protein